MIQHKVYIDGKYIGRFSNYAKPSDSTIKQIIKKRYHVSVKRITIEHIEV